MAAPSPAGTERLGFQEAVKRALSRNPTLMVALAEIDRAEALITESRAGWLPTLIGNGLYTRLDHARVLNGRVISAENQLTGNLALTVPLLAPQNWANTWHARSTRRVAISNAADVRREIGQATARAYLTVVAQRRLVTVAESARETAKAHYEYAHTRLQGGIGRAIDEVRAQQDVATVDVQVQSAYTALARAREALGVLLAAAGPVDAREDADLGVPPPLAAALDEARARRTDVKAAANRVAAAQKLIDDVWVYYAPYLAAVGQPFVQAGSAFQPQYGWQAQLVLTLPLFDGGLRSGVSHERDALLAEARANLEASVRQAESEVRLGFESLLRADQALISARQAARLARRAYELANIAYQAGASTNLEVIDAAQRARDADVAAAQSEDVARQARLDLLVASGRFP
jgi:outer membrane protein TolC